MNWKIENKLLVKELEFANFSEAIDFVNKILPLAEEANHHPDLLIHSYKKVKVVLYTHSENKITDKADKSTAIVHIFIHLGFDSVMARLPKRSLEALKVVIFAEHEDSKAQPQDITDLDNVLVEIDQFGIRISRRE